MAFCGSCKTIILFGWKEFYGKVFCNKECLNQGKIDFISKWLDKDIVEDQTLEIYKSDCLSCWEYRRNDAYYSYKISSFIYWSYRQEEVHICCKVCATKEHIFWVLYCLALWWWALPFWPILTLYYIWKNLYQIVLIPNGEPSKRLEDYVKNSIATDMFYKDD